MTSQPKPMQNPIYFVAWAPGSKQILTASYDRSIKLWDVASGNLVKEFKPAPDVKPGDKAEPPKEPVVFFKATSSIIGAFKCSAPVSPPVVNEGMPNRLSSSQRRWRQPLPAEFELYGPDRTT